MPLRPPWRGHRRPSLRPLWLARGRRALQSKALLEAAGRGQSGAPVGRGQRLAPPPGHALCRGEPALPLGSQVLLSRCLCSRGP